MKSAVLFFTPYWEDRQTDSGITVYIRKKVKEITDKNENKSKNIKIDRKGIISLMFELRQVFNKNRKMLCTPKGRYFLT